MNRTMLFAATLGVAGMLLGAGLGLDPAHAQQKKDVPIKIYVIDVDKVFKDYDKFKTLRDAWQTEIQDREKQLRAVDEMIRSKMEQRNSLKGQQDRDRIELEINELSFKGKKMKRDYEVDMARKQADMMATVYKEMSDVLEKACKEHGIHLVIRANENSIQNGVDDPRKTMATLQRQVVYHDPNLDLTDYVTKKLNKK